MVFQVISLLVCISAPLTLCRRLKDALRRDSKAPVPHEPPLPQPKSWTAQRDVSLYFEPRALDCDIWAANRDYLDHDVWLHDRHTVDLRRPPCLPQPWERRREYILNKLHGRYE